MADVNMPNASGTMEEGTLGGWKKKSGDPVKKGEVIAEVESDKATFDLESESDGVLDIIVPQGVPAKIGAPIARIGAPGEALAAPKEATPKVEAAKAEKPKAEAEAAPPPPSPKPVAQPAPATQDANGAAAGSAEVKASPLPKRPAP